MSVELRHFCPQSTILEYNNLHGQFESQEYEVLHIYLSVGIFFV